jgi:ABC-type sulfate/molybdate transport systems ATPase subunit
VHREHGLTTLHICHNREETEKLADRVGTMKNGRMVSVEARRAGA